MLEIKLDKLRSRDAHGEIDFRKLKSAEKLKCNEYSKTALVMFAHFTYMYATAKDRIATKACTHFETLPLFEIAECACCDPDESMNSIWLFLHYFTLTVECMYGNSLTCTLPKLHTVRPYTIYTQEYHRVHIQLDACEFISSPEDRRRKYRNFWPYECMYACICHQ